MPSNVPKILEMGVIGRQLAGDVAAGVSYEAGDGDRMVFCEGYAEGADGSLYAWEVMTRDWREERAGQKSHEGQETRVPSLGRERVPVEIVECLDLAGASHTATVVDLPSFGNALLEEMRTAPDEDRAQFFTWVEGDPPS